MLSGDPPLPILATEQIQKVLEENKELIMAVLDCQNQGKFGEIAQYQARLQNNLTFLAKLADVAPQAQLHTQGQDLQQSHVAMSQQVQGQGMMQPRVAMSQQQPDHSTLNLPIGMNDEQQQEQQHLAISLQQPGLSTSNSHFQMNEQQQQPPHIAALFHQQLQLVPGTTGNFPGTSNCMYQASQARLGNVIDAPSSNDFGSGMGPGWS